ncbi:hypothetical protein ILUMI_00061 [Ignelater luminosus]|uniref:Uncharacterized protein n=1 Tax=Ignelater luminosus TaxID=2038154 RepID=A0A8K0DGY9_IGNLU|nr:hypothetical protein ILUMI_00061 [Ignelater luminosus]
MDKVRNKDVIRRIGEERRLLSTIQGRKKSWVGHVLRRDNLLKDVFGKGALPVNDKWKCVNEKGLCISCLKNSHAIGRCFRKRACGINGCVKFHHKTLHNKDSLRNGENTNTSNTKKEVVDEQAQVVVHTSKEYWKTGLLWKTDEEWLPESKNMAIWCMSHIEGKMKNNKGFAEKYRNKIKEYQDKGYTKLVPESESEEENGKQISMKCFQVKIKKANQAPQRFLWRNEKSGKVKTYSMQVMIFGAVCSSFSAQYVKNRNILEYHKECSRAVDGIINRHYMDDDLHSVDTKEEAIKLVNEVMKKPAVLVGEKIPTKGDVLRVIISVFDLLALLTQYNKKKINVAGNMKKWDYVR